GFDHVKVFSGANTDVLLQSFLAFGGFLGGVTVAGGETNGDGVADVIVGAASAVSPVKVFSGTNSNVLLQSFLAFPGFTAGATVGASDLNGDGRADIVVGTKPSAAAVKAFDGLTLNLLQSFLPFPGFLGGVSVA